MTTARLFLVAFRDGSVMTFFRALATTDHLLPRVRMTSSNGLSSEKCNRGLTPPLLLLLSHFLRHTPYCKLIPPLLLLLSHLHRIIIITTGMIITTSSEKKKNSPGVYNQKITEMYHRNSNLTAYQVQPETTVHSTNEGKPFSPTRRDLTEYPAVNT